MKKLNTAFTIAELLLTVTIVGVVAAVIVPNVYTATKQNTTGATLSKAVQDIELGLANIISQAQNKDDKFTPLFSITQADIFNNNSESYVIEDNNMLNNYKSFFNLTKLDDNYLAEKAKDYNKADIKSSSVAYFITSKSYNAYRNPKTRVTYIYKGVKSNDITNYQEDKEISDDTVLSTIAIDTNGPKKPNLLGHDIFIFGISNNGHLVPAGSQEFKNGINLSNTKLYTEDCADTISGDGSTCAARVMADGWTVKYKTIGD